jgi:chromosome partitioning protein
MISVRRAMVRETKVVVLAASKGGPGKTTLAAALAVRACQESQGVALIDLDPQQSLARWWELRGAWKHPELIADVEVPSAGVETARGKGCDWVFIDTPPGFLSTIEAAIGVANLVLVPVRASALDVEAVAPVVELCQAQNVPFAFVINQAEARWKMTESAANFLGNYGKVLEEFVSYRKPYITGMTLGQTGPEVENDGKCSAEINALWRVVKKLARARVGA